MEQKPNSSSIISIFSAENEEVRLIEPIGIAGSIEMWLNHLLKGIKLTLTDSIVKCCEIDKFTIEVIKMYPEQVLCLVKSIRFTKQTEKAIGSMSLQVHLKSIKNEITFFTTNIPFDVDNLIKIKVRSILMDLVHQATIVKNLIDENVTSVQDWCWLQQMKFYLNATTKLVTAKMVYAEFDYSYEYLGNFNRLVDTKLTHNCYLTLTQAMQLGLGGNPFGPAGMFTISSVFIFIFSCVVNVNCNLIW